MASTFIYRVSAPARRLALVAAAGLAAVFSGLSSMPAAAVAGEDSVLVVVSEPVHLRLGDEREWATFPPDPDGQVLEQVFHADEPARWQTLRWQQEDVRRRWSLYLNGRWISRLADDEARMTQMVEIPPGLLEEGENLLYISSEEETGPDDIIVGSVELISAPVDALLTQARADLRITGADGSPMPARITVVDRARALQPLSAPAQDHYASRAGVLYTASGEAELSLPGGSYTIFASRGPAYEVDSVSIDLSTGDHLNHTFRLPEAPMPGGYVSVDTHLHTLELSGHGDASVAERLVTLVGEGLDAAILTEHNLHASLVDSAVSRNIAQELLLVAGNEFTTPLGHFNVFPVDPTETAPSPEVASWDDVRRRLSALSDARIVILNHGRDRHAGFVPLGDGRYMPISGERLDGAVLPANAMEVWNSSAQLQDPLELFHDWLGMLNRGIRITPVAGSDSHDVSRYGVGQGRTYVHCAGCRTGAASLDSVVQAVADGRVLPSMGLVTEILINGRPAAGEVVHLTGEEPQEAVVRVFGPSWLMADSVAVYQNGSRVLSIPVSRGSASGLKEEVRIPLHDLLHDVGLVALATGPAPDAPFWPLPKPYQRKSETWTPRIAGASGVARIDADGDGVWTSPHGYAGLLLEEHAADPVALLAALQDYEDAVAIQVASLVRARRSTEQQVAIQHALASAPERVAAAFEAYFRAISE